MLLKLILTYYNKGVEALEADASFAKLAALPVREAIGRFKYVPEAECEARYAAAMEELEPEHADRRRKRGCVRNTARFRKLQAR